MSEEAINLTASSDAQGAARALRAAGSPLRVPLVVTTAPLSVLDEERKSNLEPARTSTPGDRHRPG
ncbi:MAG TPA: hypothetical protein VK217_02490 [Acidimicrobiales bacterium]|nr:hypothetical protein [Acidimicrobiales bacterium]